MAKRFFGGKSGNQSLGKYGVPTDSFVEDFGQPLVGELPDNYEGSAEGMERRFEDNVSKMKKSLNRGSGSF